MPILLANADVGVEAVVVRLDGRPAGGKEARHGKQGACVVWTMCMGGQMKGEWPLPARFVRKRCRRMAEPPLDDGVLCGWALVGSERWSSCVSAVVSNDLRGRCDS